MSSITKVYDNSRNCCRYFSYLFQVLEHVHGDIQCIKVSCTTPFVLEICTKQSLARIHMQIIFQICTVSRLLITELLTSNRTAIYGVNIHKLYHSSINLCSLYFHSPSLQIVKMNLGEASPSSLIYSSLITAVL